MAIYHPRYQAKFDVFKRELLSTYEIRCLGPISNFLSIRITRDITQLKLWLMLDAFIEKAAQRFYIDLGVKAPYTPLPPRVDLTTYKG